MITEPLTCYSSGQCWCLKIYCTHSFSRNAQSKSRVKVLNNFYRHDLTVLSRVWSKTVFASGTDDISTEIPSKWFCQYLPRRTVPPVLHIEDYFMPSAHNDIIKLPSIPDQWFLKESGAVITFISGLIKYLYEICAVLQTQLKFCFHNINGHMDFQGKQK